MLRGRILPSGGEFTPNHSIGVDAQDECGTGDRRLESEHVVARLERRLLRRESGFDPGCLGCPDSLQVVTRAGPVSFLSWGSQAVVAFGQKRRIEPQDPVVIREGDAARKHHHLTFESGAGRSRQPSLDGCPRGDYECRRCSQVAPGAQPVNPPAFGDGSHRPLEVVHPGEGRALLGQLGLLRKADLKTHHLLGREIAVDVVEDRREVFFAGLHGRRPFLLRHSWSFCLARCRRTATVVLGIPCASAVSCTLIPLS